MGIKIILRKIIFPYRDLEGKKVNLQITDHFYYNEKVVGKKIKKN